MTLFEVVVLPRPIVQGIEVLLIFAILGLVALALAALAPGQRRR